jgi:hypothetical protein
MNTQRGAHEKRDGASDPDAGAATRRSPNRPPNWPRHSWNLRSVLAVIIATGGLAALLVVSISGISQIGSIRSDDNVVTSELSDSLYSCLSNQVRHEVPPDSEVWISPDAPDVSAGPRLPLIANPLRVVVAAYDTLTSVRTGHINLVLVQGRNKGACLGLAVVRSSPPVSSHEAQTGMHPATQASGAQGAQRSHRAHLQTELH